MPATPPTTVVSTTTPHSTTTSTTPSSTTGTPSLPTTTTVAPKPCSVVSKNVTVTNKHGCIGVLQQTRCVGGCESNTDIDFFIFPFVQRDCSCCQPSAIGRAQTEMKCGGRKYLHKYIVIRACECTACGTNPVQKKEHEFSQLIRNSTSPINI